MPLVSQLGAFISHFASRPLLPSKKRSKNVPMKSGGGKRGVRRWTSGKRYDRCSYYCSVECGYTCTGGDDQDLCGATCGDGVRCVREEECTGAAVRKTVARGRVKGAASDGPPGAGQNSRRSASAGESMRMPAPPHLEKRRWVSARVPGGVELHLASAGAGRAGTHARRCAGRGRTAGGVGGVRRQPVIKAGNEERRGAAQKRRLLKSVQLQGVRGLPCYPTHGGQSANPACCVLNDWDARGTSGDRAVPPSLG